MHWGIVCEHGFVFLHHIHNLLGSGISKHRGWRKSLWGSLKITITARIWCSISNLMHLCICVSFCHFKFVFTLFFASSCLNFRNISSRFKSDSRNNLCFSICTLASWSTLAVSCDKACCCERTIFLFLWEATRFFSFCFGLQRWQNLLLDYHHDLIYPLLFDLRLHLLSILHPDQMINPENWLLTLFQNLFLKKPHLIYKIILAPQVKVRYRSSIYLLVYATRPLDLHTSSLTWVYLYLVVDILTLFRP